MSVSSIPPAVGLWTATTSSWLAMMFETHFVPERASPTRMIGRIDAASTSGDRPAAAGAACATGELSMFTFIRLAILPLARAARVPAGDRKSGVSGQGGG